MKANEVLWRKPCRVARRRKRNKATTQMYHVHQQEAVDGAMGDGSNMLRNDAIKGVSIDLVFSLSHRTLFGP